MSLIEQDLFEWTSSRLSLSQNLEALSISPLRQEASAREYFRVNTKEISFVSVFCPPESESIEKYKELFNLHPDSKYADDAVMKVSEYYYTKGLYVK